MNIKLKRLEIDNFKGVKHRVVDFGDTTRISGANATGKTSLFDAFTFLLFDKDSLGNSKFNIRPLDAIGNKIHNVEIKVVATLDIDGKEVEISKTQKEKWVKKRGTGTSELQGNENLFEIDGYPKTEKEFKSFVAELLSEDLFKVLTNPQHFPNLPWKEQRAILMRFAEDVSDADLAVQFGGFEDLVIELEKAPSTDDIQKKYTKFSSEWKKKLTELPVRIDELERSKVDVDVAEMELAKVDLQRQLKEAQDKKLELEKRAELAHESSRGIMELKFKLSDLQIAANEHLDKKRSEFKEKIFQASREASGVELKLESKKRAIGFDERDRKILLDRIQKQGELFKEAQALVFDDSETVCTYCGQEYPEDKKEQMRAAFEANKQAQMKLISDKGNELTAEYKALGETMKSHKAEILSMESLLKSMQAHAEELNKALDEVPDDVDISEREDVLALKKQISDAEQAMEVEHKILEEKETVAYEIDQLQRKIWGVDAEIAKTDNNNAIAERISELQAEQRTVAQKVADQEKMIYLLEKFIRSKMDYVSAGINAKFGGVAFKLFESQINGGVKECCECTVNGVPYGSLNNGHRIVAGLTIIKALQNLYGAYLPIWVDNAESINDFNIPQMENQMILLAVSDDKEMKVEV